MSHGRKTQDFCIFACYWDTKPAFIFFLRRLWVINDFQHSLVPVVCSLINPRQMEDPCGNRESVAIIWNKEWPLGTGRILVAFQCFLGHFSLTVSLAYHFPRSAATYEEDFVPSPSPFLSCTVSCNMCLGEGGLTGGS